MKNLVINFSTDTDLSRVRFDRNILGMVFEWFRSKVIPEKERIQVMVYVKDEKKHLSSPTLHVHEGHRHVQVVSKYQFACPGVFERIASCPCPKHVRYAIREQSNVSVLLSYQPSCETFSQNFQHNSSNSYEIALSYILSSMWCLST